MLSVVISWLTLVVMSSDIRKLFDRATDIMLKDHEGIIRRILRI